MNPMEKTESFQAIQTVDENGQFYTQKERDQAKTARTLLQAMGCPTPQELKRLISLNLINNCPVTAKDIDRMVDIYGGDSGSIKGKTTRSKPKQAGDDRVQIPQALVERQSRVQLSIDGLEVNGIKFLTSICHNIKYRTAQAVQRGTIDEPVKHGTNNLPNI